MVALKGNLKNNISSNYSDNDTTTDDDSVEATLLPILNIVVTNPQENFDVYPLGPITKNIQS